MINGLMSELFVIQFHICNTYDTQLRVKDVFHEWHLEALPTPLPQYLKLVVMTMSVSEDYVVEDVVTQPDEISGDTQFDLAIDG